jgi:pyruvate-formate lyase
MAETGEDREIKARLEANETERFRESQQLARKTKEANRRRARKLKEAVDPNLYPPGSIPGLPGRP